MAGRLPGGHSKKKCLGQRAHSVQRLRGKRPRSLGREHQVVQHEFRSTRSRAAERAAGQGRLGDPTSAEPRKPGGGAGFSPRAAEGLLLCVGNVALGSGEQARRRSKAKGRELEREPGDCPARGRSAGDLDRGSSAGDGEETGGWGACALSRSVLGSLAGGGRLGTCSPWALPSSRSALPPAS